MDDFAPAIRAIPVTEVVLDHRAALLADIRLTVVAPQDFGNADAVL
jgi:hypothetical protein